MDEQEKKLTEKESLELITEMIGKAKHHFHESGTSAILWGSIVGIAGLINAAELFWNFYIGFDIWLLIIIALVVQVFIIIRESRTRQVITHTEEVLNTIWMIYGFSIFALVFYLNIVPGVTDTQLAKEGISLVQSKSGGTATFHYFIPSLSSLFLLLYAIPTLATGVAHKFKPMTYAAILCYVFFVISCFTPNDYDMLLTGLAGIFNWLIPGLILRRRFFQHKKVMNV